MDSYKLYIESLNFDLLSNYQLYELVRNKNLDVDIRLLANNIFEKRDLNINEIKELEEKHNSLFVSKDPIGLETYQKIILIICPAFILIHSLIAGRLYAKGKIQKWKDYWFYLCLGCMLWTIGIVLYAKFSLFKGYT